MSQQDLPRFAATREFVAQAGPIHAVALTTCWLALIVLGGVSFAATLPVPPSDAYAALAAFGLWVAFFVFPAGVLWGGLREDAEDRQDTPDDQGGEGA